MQLLVENFLLSPDEHDYTTVTHSKGSPALLGRTPYYPGLLENLNNRVDCSSILSFIILSVAAYLFVNHRFKGWAK